jgi:putative addiction module component (TIGR02574 family)
MPATTTPETPEVRAVLDQAMKLSATERAVIGRVLLDSVYPPPNTYESADALRAELQRRIEDVESGKVKTHTLEETMAYLRQVATEGGRQ